MSGVGDLFGGSSSGGSTDEHPSHVKGEFDVAGVFGGGASQSSPGAPRVADEPTQPVTAQVPTFFKILDDAGADAEPSVHGTPGPTTGTPLFDRSGGLTDAEHRSAMGALDTVAIDQPVSAHDHVGERESEPFVSLAVRKPSRRGRRIGIAAAVVAVGLIAGGVTLGVVLNQKPSTVEALEQLDAARATLVTRTDSINAEIDALEIAKTKGDAVAAGFAAAIAEMATATDESVRASTEQARAAYAQAIDAVTVPDRAHAAQPAELDTTDLAAVEAERDAVNVQVRALETLAADVASHHRSIDAADSAFREAVAGFAASFPAFATAVASESTDAAETFRTAVVEKAHAAAAADAFGPEGTASWRAYADAVAAVRADQQRGREEREAAEDDDEDDYYYYSPPIVTPGPTPIDPGPVDPGPVDPDPVDPGPVDPQPGDPVDPVEPTPGDPSPTP